MLISLGTKAITYFFCACCAGAALGTTAAARVKSRMNAENPSFDFGDFILVGGKGILFETELPVNQGAGAYSTPQGQLRCWRRNSMISGSTAESSKRPIPPPP